MSIAGIPNSDKFCKKSLHRRNDSDELDVFEAARYFSAANEVPIYNGPQKMTREERQGWRGGRNSLDMPMRNSIPSQNLGGMEKASKEKKYKQPSSPGGKLASFLNSLFNQKTSKKKKAKSSTQSMKDKDESPGGRKRRSSISHFRSAFSSDSKSIFSTSSSGFRTPPPYANTPIKAYKDWNSYSDHHKQVVPLPKHNELVKSTSLQNGGNFDKLSSDYASLDEKFKLISSGIQEKSKHHNGVSGKNRGDKEFKRFDIVDDGAESDSSSDLFELENYDLGFSSSGLPVYETTHMDNIKRGPLISNGTI